MVRNVRSLKLQISINMADKITHFASSLAMSESNMNTSRISYTLEILWATFCLGCLSMHGSLTDITFLLWILQILKRWLILPGRRLWSFLSQKDNHSQSNRFWITVLQY